MKRIRGYHKQVNGRRVYVKPYIRGDSRKVKSKKPIYYSKSLDGESTHISYDEAKEVLRKKPRMIRQLRIGRNGVDAYIPDKDLKRLTK